MLQQGPDAVEHVRASPASVAARAKTRASKAWAGGCGAVR